MFNMKEEEKGVRTVDKHFIDERCAPERIIPKHRWRKCRMVSTKPTVPKDCFRTCALAKPTDSGDNSHDDVLFDAL